MRPSDICRQHGLENLMELRNKSPVPRSTLLHWANEKPDWFLMAVKAAAYDKKTNSSN